MVPEVEQGSTKQLLKKEAQVQLCMYFVRHLTRTVTTKTIAAHVIAVVPSKCHLMLARNCGNNRHTTQRNFQLDKLLVQKWSGHRHHARPFPPQLQIFLHWDTRFLRWQESLVCAVNNSLIQACDTPCR